MKFTKLKRTVALMMVALKIKELPIEEGKVNFSEDQLEELRTAFGGTIDLDKALDAVNKELAEMKEGAIENDQRLIDARDEIQKMLKEHGLAEEDVEEAAEGQEDNKDVSAQIKAMLEKYSTSVDEKLQKLIKSSEEDTPQAQLENGKTDMKHSDTHLYGSNKVYDELEGRAWNQIAAGVQGVSMPKFEAGSLEVQKLANDLDLYNRQTNSKLTSLFRDTLKLPSFWTLRSNVDDRVADGNIVTAEITQARKKGWLPKNQQLIQPEEAQVYPAQVDIEHAGYELQKWLTSWLADYNKEGSQAYKWSFVEYLNMELDKRRGQEDRVVSIKGVHVATPDNTNIPGLAIHRGDGILIKLWRALYYDKKYRVAQIEAPTKQNILDHEVQLIEKNIPEEERNAPGLILYMSPDWVRARMTRKRIEYGENTTFKNEELLEIENYPNIKICPLVDLAGSDFMFITYDNNIGLMENVPGERGMYRMETLKRDVFIFSDYKWGPRIFHIGMKVKEGDPNSFKVQTVWTNGMPMFKKDFFVRLYDDGTGEIKLPYSNITITDDWTSNIETLSNGYAGQIVRIKGNASIQGAAKVVDDGNISLTGDADFNLNTGGVITLLCNGDNTYTELKRTTEPDQDPGEEDVEFNGTAIDADEGYTFNYTGGNANFTGITGGIEGQAITINGGEGGTLTVDDIAGNVNVSAAAAIADGDYLKLTLVDGVWEETDRSIA
ncbi:hypothetical protein [Altibacter sp. HG106]|uniref:hypothetical protein n=1 Tax=Altibacter sp. HG106 TaxID=3023937 RepID=UPI00234FCA1C|nr:hypothetical protein [Altibacter sp. HG106]MDC7994455.1 hypothetical protein [Altibacter sp. HG106]